MTLSTLHSTTLMPCFKTFREIHPWSPAPLRRFTRALFMSETSHLCRDKLGGWTGEPRVKGAGAGIEGAVGGGRGGGDNINYLVKIITENKVFHFLRNWMLLAASDVCQIPFFTFISLGLAISFPVCLCLSLPLSLSHMKREVSKYVSEESN